MIIISWNVRGISERDKQALNKKEITENNPTIVILQETKTTIFDIPLIQSLWSFRNVGWIALEANGSTGGILIMWNDPSFTVTNITKGEFTLSLHITMVDG